MKNRFASFPVPRTLEVAMRHILFLRFIAALALLATSLPALGQEGALKDRISDDVKGRRIMSTEDETAEGDRPVIRESGAFDPQSGEALETVFLKAEPVAGSLRVAAFYSPGRKVYWIYAWGGPKKVHLLHGPWELRTVTMGMVEAALRKLITPEGNVGFYEGQFKELESMGKGVVPFLLEIFKDESRPAPMRSLSLEALGDLKDPGAVTTLRELYANEDYAPFHEAMIFTLARLGDMELADKQIQGLKQYIENAEGSEEAQAEGYTRLAHAYARLNRNEDAIECYKKAIALNPDSAASSYYNMACAYAVLKRVDDGIDALRKAVDAGYDDYDWLQLDGDLNNLRKDPRFLELVKKMREK
jgi:tetratricopeptide (TPR) repeat protein